MRAVEGSLGYPLKRGKERKALAWKKERLGAPGFERVRSLDLLSILLDVLLNVQDIEPHSAQ